MVISYVAENDQKQVIGWFSKLSHAKECVIANGSGLIIKLSGPRFGEGYHMYKLKFMSGKFKKIS